MNNCLNCGAMLLEGATVCPVCRQPTGAAQGSANWQPQQQQPAAPPVAPWQPPSHYIQQRAASGSNTSLNVVWLLAIVFLAVLVVVGAAGALVYLRSRTVARIDNENKELENLTKPLPDSPTSDPDSPPPQPRNRSSNSRPISGGVLNGKAISLPKPTYPAVAKAARASGTVVVQVTVDESGNVTSASAVSGHQLLRASAVQAARQARFSPTILSGKPVKVTGVLNYTFSLE